MTYSFVWGVPRYLSSSFSAEGSLLSITCMIYISSDMCFWNRELITCTLSKLGICWYYFSYSPYVTLRNENIKEAETNLTDKDDKRDIFFQFMCNAIYHTFGYFWPFEWTWTTSFFLPISRNILQITYTTVPVSRPVNGQTWLLVNFRPLG